MMKGIVSIPSKTIRLIAEQLDCPVWINGHGIMPVYMDAVIRWGSTRKVLEYDKEINSIEAIEKASDKKLCRSLLAEAGIPVPQEGSDSFPCIGRPRKHWGGKRFWVCRNYYDVQNAISRGAEYFAWFYPKTKEYRVHIGHNKVILYSEKLGDRSRFIWNKRKSGFTFRHMRRSEWDIEIVRLAKKAIKAVGLDFGAVDIMADPTDSSLPRAVVSEINTAPAGSPYMVKCYARYFDRILEEDSD